MLILGIKPFGKKKFFQAVAREHIGFVKGNQFVEKKVITHESKKQRLDELTAKMPLTVR